jgi:hypothetical protein
LAGTWSNRAPILSSSRQVEAFGQLMRDNLTSGHVVFRKAYIGAMVDRIEVDDEQIRIIGQKDVPAAAVSGKNGPRGGVRRWRAVLNKSANTYVIEVAV